MKQNEYNKLIKNIKKRDTMPYDDIVLIENKLQELKKSVTVDDFYKYIEKEMNRKRFDVILNYLLETDRLEIEEDEGWLYTAWCPVSVEKALSDGTTLY